MKWHTSITELKETANETSQFGRLEKKFSENARQYAILFPSENKPPESASRSGVHRPHRYTLKMKGPEHCTAPTPASITDQAHDKARKPVQKKPPKAASRASVYSVHTLMERDIEHCTDTTHGNTFASTVENLKSLITFQGLIFKLFENKKKVGRQQKFSRKHTHNARAGTHSEASLLRRRNTRELLRR